MNVMKNYTILFLILALITGLTGFTGFNFDGVEVTRVLCLIFTDLFIVSLFTKALFPDDKKLRYQKIKN